MKITIEAQALAGAVKRASLAVENRSTIPIINNLLLTATGGTLALFGTDMDLSVEATAPAAPDYAEGACTVNAKALAALASGFAKGSLVEIDGTVPGCVTVRSGRSSSTLPTLPAAGMPRMLPKPLAAQFTLPAAVLLAEIDRVKHAISTEEMRYYINGIYWHRHESKLRMVATDGHILALSDTGAPSGSDAMPGVIVPIRTVSVLRKLISAKSAPPAECEVGPAQLIFRVGATVLMSKVIDGTFPDYQRVISRSNMIKIKFDRKEAIAAVTRLLKLASDRMYAVEFDAKGDSLDLSIKDYKTGTAAESIPAHFTKLIEFGLNGRHFISALSACLGETVVLELHDAVSPVVINEPNATHVIITMRV